MSEAEVPDQEPRGEASAKDATDAGRERAARKRYRHRAPLVTVFGAGLTGLAAAHELAERGMRVQVVDPTPDPHDEYGVGVGGIAANQYGAVPADLERLHPYLFPEERFDYLEMLWPEDPSGHADEAPVLDPIAKRFIEEHHEPDRPPTPEEGRLIAQEAQPYVAAIRDLRAAPLTPTRDPLALRATLPFVPKGARRHVPPEIDEFLGTRDRRKRRNTQRLDDIEDEIVAALGQRLVQLAEALEVARPDVPPDSLRRITADLLRRELLLVEIVGHVDPATGPADAVPLTRQVARLAREAVIRRLQSRRGDIDAELLLRVFGPALGAGWPKERVADWFWGARPDSSPGIGDCLVARAEGSSKPLSRAGSRSGRRANDRVELAAVERLLPGEHGFRFFPGYYRHTFDTMRRTPIVDARGRDTGRTCFDSLVAPPDVAVALATTRSIEPIPRKRIESVEELRRGLEVMFERVGYAPRDMRRYFLQIFRFMTSCDARRRRYEGLTWLEFLDRREEHVEESIRGTTGYSERGEALIVETPRALVAMDAEETDALSHGLTSVQLLLDYQTDGATTDMILDGPTDEAWLRHWKRHLKRQGVRFFRGRLAALVTAPDAGPERVVPVIVDAPVDGGPPPGATVPEDAWKPEDPVVDEDSVDVFEHDADFFLLALPYAAAASLVRTAATRRDRPARLDGDLARLDRFHRLHVAPGLWDLAWEDGRISPRRDAYGRPELRSLPLRDLSGIQLFFDTRVRLGAGHLMYPDSSWGLSSISQLAHWRERSSDRRGFLGQISVDIGDFYRTHALEDADRVYGWTRLDERVRRTREDEERTRRDGGRPGRSAFRCGSLDLAIRVWDQIVATQPPEWVARVTPPDYFHVDRHLEFGAGQTHVAENHALFFINVPGQWSDRPGVLRCDGPEDEAIRYQVSNRHWLLAGSFMATHTRLMTMEACIESARHAVNAVLEAVRADTYCDRYDGGGRFLGDPCAIHDPARHEVPDLEPLRRLDERLCAARVPHFLDVLGIPDWVDSLPDPDPEPGERPGYDLGRVVADGASNVLEDWRFALPTAEDWLRQAQQAGHAAGMDSLRTVLADPGVRALIRDVSDIVSEAVRAARGGGSASGPGDGRSRGRRSGWGPDSG